MLDHIRARAILIDNAGINANFDATTMTSDEWDRFMGVDLKSAWLGAKYVLPHMREAGRGAIVNVIRFLASDDASYVTGTTIHIDGGVTARRAG
jgi:NAD(P)-dependent dehydrogenase (short-subunit alcohol dehydrogenase family)